MYRACRHIKPNGLRCESPALRDRDFCYFHSKLRNEPYEKFGPMRLPVPEDRAAIQIALAKITEALLNNSIDPKRAGHLLYSMQIAATTMPAMPGKPVESVDSVTSTATGEDLAPELRVCSEKDICVGCPHAATCPNYDPSKQSKRSRDKRSKRAEPKK